MDDKIIYYVEAFDPTTRSRRVGIFREKATAESWSHGFGRDVEQKITPVHLTDRRYNHNLEGELNKALFRVHWLPGGAQPIPPAPVTL